MSASYNTISDPVAAQNLEFIMREAQVNCHANFVELLTKLMPCQTVGNEVVAGLIDAPAGRRYHHNKRHGLIEHLADMLRMWQELSMSSGTFHSLYECVPNADYYMTTGILMHDLHKAHQFYTINAVQSDLDVFADVEVSYSFDYYKKKDICLDNDQQSLSLMLLADVPIDSLLLQMVFNAEGGYSKHRNQNVHALTKALYLLDEMSVLNWRVANDKIVTQP